MPTPWLPGPSVQATEVSGASEGALSRLEKFMDNNDGVDRSLKAKSGSQVQESPSSIDGQTPPGPLVQQYPVEASSPSVRPTKGAASSEAAGEHESESDMEIQTVFLGGDSKSQDASLGNGLPKSSIQDDRQHLHNRTAASEETSTANFNGGPGFNATSWVAQVVSPDSTSFASQNLKYMKALNDPYVKALAAHRRELNASRIDLEREYVDTMASKLSTQRSGALATLNVRDGRGHPAATAPAAPENGGRCQCYGMDNSLCENDAAGEADHEKVVMVPYYASAGQLPEDTSRSAASSAYGATTTGRTSQDVPPIEGHPSGGSSWSLPWLSSVSNKIPALPDILSVMVGAEPLNSARQHNKDPQRQIPLSELIDGMETQL